MKKILVILAHPEPLSMNGSMFSKAVETLIKAGHEVKTTDLYSLHFNPVSDRTNFTTVNNPEFYKQQLEEMFAVRMNGFAADIAREQEKVEWCDLMIWQFPLWWFTVPGVLKGWVDRVFAMGRFYGQGMIYENGVFRDKKALLSITTGGTEGDYLPEGLQGDINQILKPIQRGMLRFTGFEVLKPHIVYGPARISEAQRQEALDKWQQRLENIFDESPIEVGSY